MDRDTDSMGGVVDHAGVVSVDTRDVGNAEESNCHLSLFSVFRRGSRLSRRLQTASVWWILVCVAGLIFDLNLVNLIIRSGRPTACLTIGYPLFACWYCSVLRDLAGHHLSSNITLGSITRNPRFREQSLSKNEWLISVCEYRFTKDRTYGFYHRCHFILPLDPMPFDPFL